MTPDVPEVVEALRDSAEGVADAGPLRWRARMAKGDAMTVDARVEAGWVVLAAEGGPGPDDCLAVAAMNHGLEASSRIGRPMGTPSLVLRAEVPLADGIDLRARVREACRGLARASRRLRSADHEPPAADSPVAGDTSSYGELCREAGWPFVERRTGLVAIDLKGADGLHQASLVPAGRSGCVLTVDLADWSGAPDVCRRALGALLLAAADAMRFVRPSAVVNGSVTAGFDVAFGTPPSAVELDEALRALSAACRWYAREVRMLRDESLAARFLGLEAGDRNDVKKAGEVWSWS